MQKVPYKTGELSVLCLYSEDTHLNVCAQFLEDLIDLIFETSTQHLVSFIQNKHLDPFWGCIRNAVSEVKYKIPYKSFPFEHDL